MLAQGGPKWAVEHWHYSGRMPLFKQNYIGVWESGAYIGCVVFGRSVTPHLGDQFSLSCTEVVELTRVALTTHECSVSRVVSIATRLIRQKNPGLRLLVSYADVNVGHVGTIYQAANWIYVGRSASIRQYWWRNQWRNDTSMFRAFKSEPSLRQACQTRRLMPKYKYLMPLDAAMRTQIEPLRQPYPKRVRSDTIDTPADQAGEGGEAPTRALHVPRETAAV